MRSERDAFRALFRLVSSGQPLFAAWLALVSSALSALTRHIKHYNAFQRIHTHRRARGSCTARQPRIDIKSFLSSFFASRVNREGCTGGAQWSLIGSRYLHARVDFRRYLYRVRLDAVRAAFTKRRAICDRIKISPTGARIAINVLWTRSHSYPRRDLGDLSRASRGGR